MRIAQMKNVHAEFVLFTAGIVLGLFSAVAVPLGPAVAETAREACTHDAFRLCSDAIPDVSKTKACLVKNRASLSPPCKAVFGSADTPRRRHRHLHR
jgi:hypothetical protein